MSSLKETIETFSVTDSWSGSKYVYVEDIPGIVVSALQDVADRFRKEISFSAWIGDSADRIKVLHEALKVVAAYQDSIVEELM